MTISAKKKKTNEAVGKVRKLILLVRRKEKESGKRKAIYLEEILKN